MCYVCYVYVKVNKCSGSCNTINDPMAKLCVPDVVKNLNLKVFNMMSRINETRKVIWHITCKCLCRLTSAICNNRQDWNENKCSCECKEDLVSKLVCDKECMWNPSTCACDCDKCCEVGQYLDYKNCVGRKKLIDDLTEQCTSVVDIEIANGTDLLTSKVSSNSNIYLYLFVILLIILLLSAAGGFWYLERLILKNLIIKFMKLLIQTLVR